MDRAIRRRWMSAACVFVLLMGTLSYIQFFDSKTLMANPWNSRALYDNYGSARGSIVVDGTEIASSVKSDDEYNYQRRGAEPEDRRDSGDGFFPLLRPEPAVLPLGFFRDCELPGANGR